MYKFKFLVPWPQFRENYTFAYISFINSFSPQFLRAKSPEKKGVMSDILAKKEEKVMEN